MHGEVQQVLSPRYCLVGVDRFLKLGSEEFDMLISRGASSCLLDLRRRASTTQSTRPSAGGGERAQSTGGGRWMGPAACNCGVQPCRRPPHRGYEDTFHGTVTNGEEVKRSVRAELERRYVMLTSHRARSVGRRVSVGNNDEPRSGRRRGQRILGGPFLTHADAPQCGSRVGRQGNAVCTREGPIDRL